MCRANLIALLLVTLASTALAQDAKSYAWKKGQEVEVVLKTRMSSSQTIRVPGDDDTTTKLSDLGQFVYVDRVEKAKDGSATRVTRNFLKATARLEEFTMQLVLQGRHVLTKRRAGSRLVGTWTDKKRLDADNARWLEACLWPAARTEWRGKDGKTSGSRESPTLKSARDLPGCVRRALKNFARQFGNESFTKVEWRIVLEGDHAPYGKAKVTIKITALEKLETEEGVMANSASWEAVSELEVRAPTKGFPSSAKPPRAGEKPKMVEDDGGDDIGGNGDSGGSVKQQKPQGTKKCLACDGTGFADCGECLGVKPEECDECSGTGKASCGGCEGTGRF